MRTQIAAALLLLSEAAIPQVRSLPEERARYFYDQRRFPYAQIPQGARMKALEEVKRLDRASSSGTAAAPALVTQVVAQGAWKHIGPEPISFGNGYVASGRVAALAVDPRSNDVVYAGGAQGGVWKTTDGGVTWKPLTDAQPSLATGSIAIDPSNPDTVYAGTGEENFSIDSYYGAGILKSTDGGATWANIVGPFLRQRIGALSVHPTDGKTILAAAANSFGTPPGEVSGVYRSTDAGATWTLVLTGTATAVFFDASQPGVAWAGLGNIFGSPANGVYRSSDNGATWSMVSGAAPNNLPGGVSAGRIELVSSPANPGTVIAAVADSFDVSNTLTGVYSSSDGGANWAKLTTPDYCHPQCWYAMPIRPDPVNANVIFAGGVRPYRSLDGGATWAPIPWNPVGSGTPHDDQHVLVFTNDGARLYDGCDGGVWSSDQFQAPTVVWNNLNATLELTQYYPGQAIDPTNPQIGLDGSQDNGPNRYGGQLQWDLIVPGVFADSGWQAIDPSSPNIAYTTTQTGYSPSLWRTQNLSSGRGFIPAAHGINLSDRQLFVAPFVLDPSSPLRMYWGTNRLYQSVDGGGLWVPISPDLTDSSIGSISAIAVSPVDPNVLYTTSNTGTVFSSTDGGQTWTDRSAGLPFRAGTQVLAHPLDPNTAYVTFSGFAIPGGTLPGHIYKSTDGGNTWTDMSGDLPNLPVNDLAIDPDVPNTFYAATDVGVMFSSNGGVNWTTLGTGLPTVAVLSLTLHRATRTLRAATHGRSAWDYALGQIASAQPVISSLSPATANAGDGPFTLTIRGTNFGSGVSVRWNGRSRTVTAATATSITAQIPASDIQGVGRAAVTVFSASQGAGESIPANFVIGPAPNIDGGGVVSAAYSLGGETGSPGALMTLYGENLTASLVTQEGYPLPYTLGDVTVTFGGVPAPLYFVAPGKPGAVAFQVPYSTALRTQPVTITQGSETSQVEQVAMSAVTPELFATNQQGTGQGAIRIAGTATIAAPLGTFPDSRPVKPGEFIEIYCTGLGAVSPPVATGAPPPSKEPLARTLAAASVSIGGVPVTNVTFSGLTPGIPGLYVVDAQIPVGITPGDAVALTVAVGGVQSNTVTVAIGGP